MKYNQFKLPHVKIAHVQEQRNTKQAIALYILRNNFRNLSVYNIFKQNIVYQIAAKFDLENSHRNINC